MRSAQLFEADRNRYSALSMLCSHSSALGACLQDLRAVGPVESAHKDSERPEQTLTLTTDLVDPSKDMDTKGPGRVCVLQPGTIQPALLET